MKLSGILLASSTAMTAVGILLCPFASLAAPAPNATSSASSPATTSMANNTYPFPMYQLSSNGEFAFILEAVLALANGGGTATGEVLRIASQVIPGDYESFYTQCKFMSDKLKAMADKIDPRRFPVSARDLYFRSASYLRFAPFFLHGNQDDPRIKDAWAQQIPMFDKAMSLMEIPGHRYNISGGNFSIPVIFFPASNDPNAKHPTILAGSGYDGAQEELWHGIGTQAVARGYNFVTYEGPGQPTVRIFQNLGFIHNWWDVVTPVVDFLEKHSNVDKEQIVLIGESFGGTLAPLATTHEKRFAATLAIDGLVSTVDAVEAQLTSGGAQQLVDLFNSGNATAFDAVMHGIQKDPTAPTNLRWLIDQGLWSFNTNSPFDWFTRLGAISLHNVTDQIPGPIFNGFGEDDTLTGNQAFVFQKALGNRSTFHDFKTNLGAGEHCQIGAEPLLSEVMYDWLSDVLARKNKTKQAYWAITSFLKE